MPPLRQDPRTCTAQGLFEQMNSGKILAVGCFGVMLIALGFDIAVTRPFATMYFVGSNPAWGFGPRELAHCVGFAGCTLAGWALIRSFATQRGRRANIVVALAGLCGFPLFLSWPAWMPFQMEHGLRKFICTIVIPFYLIGSVMLRQYVKDWPSLTRPTQAALMSAGMMWIWSLTWEVGIQPHEYVYEGPPRGYIQWAQLLSDFVGIWVPALGLIGLRHHIANDTPSAVSKSAAL
jgi:hypothetical protein